MSVATYGRRCVLVALAAVAAGLAGCGAGRLIKQGDANLLADRPHQAVRFYGEALEKDSDLAHDPEFTRKLQRARCLAAYHDGMDAGERGDWEGAIDKFSESLRIDPDFEQAAQARDRAQRKAAAARHARALKLADQGDLGGAAAELKIGLRLNGLDADIRAALDSLSPSAQDAHGLHARLLALRGEKRWLKASELLQQAIAADPNHLPSRAELKQCNDALAQANVHYTRGSQLLSARKLDEAIAALEESLEIWPFNEHAGELLSQARARRKQFDDLHGQAQSAFRAARWDQAIALAQAALKIVPHHRGARELCTQATLNAAAVQTEHGQRLLAAGNLDEAEKRFGRALTYAANMQSAREGLGQVYFLRGQAGERTALWGNALVWYMQACEQAHNREYLAARDQARARVAERVSFRLGLVANDPPLRMRLTGRLAAEKPAYVRLVVGGAAARQAEYAADVNLTRLDVRDRIVRTERRAHRYAVSRAFPNPSIPRLRRLVAEARDDLARLRRAHARKCPDCKGEGKLTCKKCRGTGSVTCSNCHGQKHLPCPKCKGAGAINGSVCPQCRGLRVIACPECRGTGKTHCPACSTEKTRRGWVRCKRCGGTGRSAKVSSSQIKEKQEQLDRLVRRLAREPATVAREVVVEWPYEVLHYEKTGKLEAHVRLTDAATGAVLAANRVRNSAEYEDVTTHKANPTIGLHADALELPSDSDVRDALTEAAAAESAGRILAAALEARTEHFNAQAKGFSRAGQTDQAVEALVNMAVVMESHRPADAAAVFSRLRNLAAGAAVGTIPAR